MIFKTHHKALLSTAIATIVSMTNLAQAQTTSSINGVVSAQTGEPLVNTHITIVHQPSNTTTQLVTNASGRFSARGLKAGGPYKVIVDSDSHQDIEQEGIYLKLGETLKLSPELLAIGNLEEVVVTADALAYEQNGGASSVFGLETLERSASFSRDIKDIARMNPLVSINPGASAEMSIAGNNPRYNSFTVDGVNQNDDFGLNGNGYPTLRSPVSLDALEQIAVNVSPFNVRASGFTGGHVNAVTKSGANEFHGSVYYEKASDSLSGGHNPNTGNDIDLEFEEKTLSVTLGGPIIQDKLFFFVSYEDYEAPQSSDWGAAGSGAVNTTGATQAQYDEVSAIAKNVYGVDLQGYNSSLLNEDEKILAKLDWNINDSHRMSYTYQDNSGAETLGTTSRSSELRDSSNWYDMNQSLKSHAVGLFSDWTDEFSTEIRLSKNTKEMLPTPRTKGFGQASINVGDGQFIRIGAEQYRHANELKTENTSLEVVANYLMDEHEIMFGFKHESLDTFNLFTANSLGVYRFNSIEDFRNREVDRLDYQNATSNIAADNAASFEVTTISLFAQDTWQVNDDLEITAGVRYETLSSGDKPTLNNNFVQRNGFNNQFNLDGLDIFLPRIGFNWTINDQMALTGGVGRYSGGKPGVWISNNYSNDGVTQVNTRIDDLSNGDITSIPQQALDDVASKAGQAAGGTNSIDPNFEIPSDWRANVNFEWQLPYDISWNLGAQYLKKENSVEWYDLSRNQESNLYSDYNNSTGRFADGRLAIKDYRINDFQLTNASDDGRSKIFTTSLDKYWDNGVSVFFSYANQDVTEGNPGSSSQAKSNYRFNATEQRDQTLVGTSAYEIEHRFTMGFNYNFEFLEGFNSNINVFWSRKSGRPFSKTLYQHYKGQTAYLDHGSRRSLLPYIPNGPEDTSVVANAADVWSDLKKVGLDKYAGGFAKKNDSRNPWINTLDFSYRQQIPGILDGHNGELTFTVQNLFALLDDSGIYSNELGVVKYHNYATVETVNVQALDDGRFAYSVRENSPSIDTEASSWKMKLGVRYRF